MTYELLIPNNKNKPAIRSLPFCNELYYVARSFREKSNLSIYEIYCNIYKLDLPHVVK